MLPKFIFFSAFVCLKFWYLNEHKWSFTLKFRGGTTRGAGGLRLPPPPPPHTFLLSNHFLFYAKKYFYANKRNQGKPLCRKRVYSKHKSIQSLRMPKFLVLKIKDAEVCFENWNNPLQINIKPRFTERKSKEDEIKKSWTLICLRSKKVFTG